MKATILELSSLNVQRPECMEEKQIAECHCWTEQRSTGGRRKPYVCRGQVLGQDLARLEPIRPRRGLCGPPC